jgi:signal transduction histidine kinase
VSTADASGVRDGERGPSLVGRAIAWSIFGVTLAGAAVREGLGLANGAGFSYFEILFLAFPTVGVVLAIRRPRNTLGWLMLAIALPFASPGTAYATYATITRHGELPGAALAFAIDAPMWVPFIGLSGFLLLLFPDGHLPSPRWRWFATTCAVGLTLLFLYILFSPSTAADSGLPQLRNPFGVPALRAAPLGVLIPFAPLTVIGGAAAIILRLRRSPDPVQRRQLRWLAWGAAIIAITYGLAFIPQVVGLPAGSRLEDVLDTIAISSFVLIPITIGIAVLRYRLYDIDLVIKKTVVFAVVVGFIAFVYVALVVGVGALVGSRGSPVLSAVAASVVALVFQPVRARARRLADRVVYGRRATPYEVLADFSDRVGETYAADDVVSRMARVVGEGIGAERSEVWIRLDEGDRVAAVWPADAVPSATPAAADASFPVEHRGEPLGSLAVVMPANDPMDPARTKLLSDLAAQAGLVLRNVRLTQELRARLDDLRAAQKRLVAAQDEERKRLERNIHDGAQQQLVALGVRMRLVDQLVDRDPARAHESLEQLQADVTTALGDLRDLARGIYPPLLADEGLAAALVAQARRATTPVEVDIALPARLAPQIEAALYFSCLECMQNVAKYAAASSIAVRVWIDDDDVVFEVEDDGRGFDPSSHGYGTGLQGIADRLGALDGSLEVRSAPGEGTTVRGRVPARPAGGNGEAG